MSDPNPTTATGLTDSTNAVLATLRQALLEYENAEGVSAADFIADRLFQGRAPDNQDFSYASMRLNTRNDGGNHGLRLVGSLEIQVFGRPWSQYPDLNRLADLFDQAMTFYVANTQGLMACYAKQRDTLPTAGSPIDSETPTIRLAYSLFIWPRYLTVLTGNDAS